MGKFSTMGFDIATSSFLALLVNKSYRKTKKAKLKKVFNFAVKNSKTFYCLKNSVN